MASSMVYVQYVSTWAITRSDVDEIDLPRYSQAWSGREERRRRRREQSAAAPGAVFKASVELMGPRSHSVGRFCRRADVENCRSSNSCQGGER